MQVARRHDLKNRPMRPGTLCFVQSSKKYYECVGDEWCEKKYFTLVEGAKLIGLRTHELKWVLNQDKSIEAVRDSRGRLSKRGNLSYASLEKCKSYYYNVNKL